MKTASCGEDHAAHEICPVCYFGGIKPKIANYNCLEIWQENDKFYKKIYAEEHEKGGVEVEITEEKFNKLSEMINGR